MDGDPTILAAMVRPNTISEASANGSSSHVRSGFVLLSSIPAALAFYESDLAVVRLAGSERNGKGADPYAGRGYLPAFEIRLQVVLDEADRAPKARRASAAVLA